MKDFSRCFSRLAVLCLLCVLYPTTSNSQTARQIFNKTYNMVFGSQGSTLHYDVNIIGVLKTNGTIWYKGKKSKFVENRYLSWNNGTDDYWVDLRKKTVTHYNAKTGRSDKYMSKFTFNAEDYNYSLEKATSTEYIIVLTARKDVKGIKHLKAVIDRKTYAPKSLKIKVLWFWTTVQISNFKSGGISDDIFVFPKSKYKDYKYTNG